MKTRFDYPLRRPFITKTSYRRGFAKDLNQQGYQSTKIKEKKTKIQKTFYQYIRVTTIFLQDLHPETAPQKHKQNVTCTL